MKKTLLLCATVASLTFTLTCVTSCKKNEDTVVAPTLYDSLGGTKMVSDPRTAGTMIESGRLGLRTVVDSTIYVIAGDNRINGFFTPLLAEVTAGNTTGFFALEKSLTDFFCVALGAKNFTYSGKNMVAAHDPAQNSRMIGKSGTAPFTKSSTNALKSAVPDFPIIREF